MNAQAAGQTVLTADTDERRTAAAQNLYDAECALHAAHQSHVNAWIAAASDKLHLAVEEFLAALSEHDRSYFEATMRSSAWPAQFVAARARTAQLERRRDVKCLLATTAEACPRRWSAAAGRWRCACGSGGERGAELVVGLKGRSGGQVPSLGRGVLYQWRRVRCRACDDVHRPLQTDTGSVLRAGPWMRQTACSRQASAH